MTKLKGTKVMQAIAETQDGKNLKYSDPYGNFLLSIIKENVIKEKRQQSEEQEYYINVDTLISDLEYALHEFNKALGVLKKLDKEGQQSVTPNKLCDQVGNLIAFDGYDCVHPACKNNDEFFEYNLEMFDHMENVALYLIHKKHQVVILLLTDGTYYTEALELSQHGTLQECLTFLIGELGLD